MGQWTYVKAQFYWRVSANALLSYVANIQPHCSTILDHHDLVTHMDSTAAAMHSTNKPPLYITMHLLHGTISPLALEAAVNDECPCMCPVPLIHDGKASKAHHLGSNIGPVNTGTQDEYLIESWVTIAVKRLVPVEHMTMVKGTTRHNFWSITERTNWKPHHFLRRH